MCKTFQANSEILKGFVKSFLFMYTLLILKDNAFQITHASCASAFVTGIEGIWVLQIIKHRQPIRTLIAGSLSFHYYKSLILDSDLFIYWYGSFASKSAPSVWFLCRVLQGFAGICLFDRGFDICKTTETKKYT